MRQREISTALLVLSFSGLLLAGQQGAPAARNAPAPPDNSGRLLTAKIVYVVPMPDNLDQWLIQDLRAWGKYQVSGNSQGVDLVIRAKRPEKKPRYVIRGGVPVEKKPAKAPPVLSITVVDWVTGERLWQADILDTHSKKDQPVAPGPQTDIDARHMTPDQIAQRCATLLRRYVTELQQKAKP